MCFRQNGKSQKDNKFFNSEIYDKSIDLKLGLGITMTSLYNKEGVNIYVN